MANLKEIVTKAVIGKAKKNSKDTYEIPVDFDISNILGCWIINHNYSGEEVDNEVNINGSYDINIWYSYDNNTKTNVIVRSFTYNETIKVKLQKDGILTDNSEIIIRSLTNPQVSDVKVENQTIKLTIEKVLGVEVVGDMLVRINTLEGYEEYEEETDNNLDMDINEDYLNGVNQN